MRHKKPGISNVKKRRIATALVVTAIPLLAAEAAFAQNSTTRAGTTPTWATPDWVPVTPEIQALLKSAGKTTPTPTPAPTAAPSTAPPTTSTPTTAPPTTVPPTTVPPTTAAPVTKTVLGSVVKDMAHGGVGNIQVQITVTGTKITAVKVVQQPTDEESQSINKTAMPKLVQEALQAQSADIAAVSGASYTSPAFKESLQAAITKAGIS